MVKTSPSRHVASSGLKLVGSQVIQNIFLLGFGVFFAHVLSVEEMAVVSIYGLLTSVIPTIVSFGLIDLLIRAIPEYLSRKEKSEASSLITTVLLIQCLFSLVLSILLIVLSEGISQIFLKTPRLSLQIKIISIGAFINTAVIFFDAVIRSMQLFGKLAKIKIVANVLSRIFALMLFFYMGFNGYLIGLIIGTLLTLIMLMYYTWNLVFFNLSFRKDYIGLVKFSFPYYLSNLSRYALINIDQYTVALFLTPTHLATYFIATRLAEYLKQIIDSFSNPILPKIAELKAEGRERLENAFFKTTRYINYLFISLAIFGATISHPLLYLYGGAKYTNGSVILAILFISMILYSYSGLITLNIHVLGRPVDKFKMDTISGLLNIVFSFSLVYILNGTGAAVAKLLSFAGSVIVGAALLKRIIRLRFDINSFRNTIIAVSAMAIAILIPQVLINNPYLLPIYISAGITAFFAIMRNMLYQYDIELINHLLPKRLKWITKYLKSCEMSKGHICPR